MHGFKVPKPEHQQLRSRVKTIVFYLPTGICKIPRQRYISQVNSPRRQLTIIPRPRIGYGCFIIHFKSGVDYSSKTTDCLSDAINSIAKKPFDVKMDNDSYPCVLRHHIPPQRYSPDLRRNQRQSRYPMTKLVPLFRLYIWI